MRKSTKSRKPDRDGKKTKKDGVGSSHLGAFSSKPGIKTDPKSGRKEGKPAPTTFQLPNCKGKKEILLVDRMS